MKLIIRIGVLTTLCLGISQLSAAAAGACGDGDAVDFIDPDAIEAAMRPYDVLAAALVDLHRCEASVTSCQGDLDGLMARSHGQRDLAIYQEALEKAQQVRVAASLRVAKLRREMRGT